MRSWNFIDILCLSAGVCLFFIMFFSISYTMGDKFGRAQVTKNMQKKAVESGLGYYDCDKNTGDVIFKYRECKCFQGNKE